MQTASRWLDRHRHPQARLHMCSAVSAAAFCSAAAVVTVLTALAAASVNSTQKLSDGHAPHSLKAVGSSVLKPFPLTPGGGSPIAAASLPRQLAHQRRADVLRHWQETNEAPSSFQTRLRPVGASLTTGRSACAAA